MAHHFMATAKISEVHSPIMTEQKSPNLLQYKKSLQFSRKLSMSAKAKGPHILNE